MKIFLVLLLVLCSCAKNYESVSPKDVILLTVENNSWSDAKLYFVKLGTTLRRLGSVGSLSSRTLHVPAYQIDGITELCVQEFAGNQRYCTGPIVQMLNSVVIVTIENRFHQSHYTIRQLDDGT